MKLETGKFTKLDFLMAEYEINYNKSCCQFFDCIYVGFVMSVVLVTIINVSGVFAFLLELLNYCL